MNKHISYSGLSWIYGRTKLLLRVIQLEIRGCYTHDSEMHTLLVGNIYLISKFSPKYSRRIMECIDTKDYL